MNIFQPNYGAASTHIAELMKERDDFIDASRAQAARITALEEENAALQEDLQTCEALKEQQALIAESRSRQIETQAEEKEKMKAKLDRATSAVRLLWALLEEQTMRIKEQNDSVNAGKELLESLSDMLSEGSGESETTDAKAWEEYAQ